MQTNFQIDLNLIDNDTVSCNGEGWSNSHPMIYLDLSSGKNVPCPYCGKKFKKKWAL